MATLFLTLPAQNVKNLKKHAIIDMIRFTPGGVARSDIARLLGLTRATVSTIIGDLHDSGFVQEVEDHHPGGRKPIVLEIPPGIGYVVGVDLGATHLMMIMADFSGREIQGVETSLNIEEGPKVCLSQVNLNLQIMLEKAGIPLREIKAIGLGVPGPIVAEAGMVSGSMIMQGWDGFPIRDYLQEIWHCPVSLSNDSDLGALGEWAYGAARGEQNVAYIKVGTGIGCGLLLKGQIYRGSTGSAGEIGHTTIDENGPLCVCGNRGCLEAMAGGRAIAIRAIEAIRMGQRTQLADISPLEDINTREIINAARRGDLYAQQIIAEAGNHLGTAVSSLVNLFSPEIVVIGGGMAQIGDLLIDPIRRTVSQRSLRAASQSVRIGVALLGRRSSAMGAVVQAISVAIHQMVDLQEKEVLGVAT